MVAAILLPGVVLFQTKINAVPIITQNTSEDGSDDEAEDDENSNDRSDKAGWMQAGSVLGTQATGKDRQKTNKKDSVATATPTTPPTTTATATPSAQDKICLDREANINHKVALISTRSQDYEKKLSSFLDHIVDLKKGYNINSPEVDALILVSSNLKATQIDPLLTALADYQGQKKISCAQGVETVVSSLVQVQAITEQLKDGLADYRNSIRAVLIALKDNSQGTTK